LQAEKYVFCKPLNNLDLFSIIIPIDITDANEGHSQPLSKYAYELGGGAILMLLIVRV